MKNNENESKSNEWVKRDIGALWKREGKNQKYLSGYVKVDDSGLEKEVKVVVFANKNKNNNEKAPDYRIYISKPIENGSSKTSQSNQEVKQKNTVTQKKAVVPQNEIEEDLL